MTGARDDTRVQGDDLEAIVTPYRSIDSCLHGPEHWRRVALFGGELARCNDLDVRARRAVEIFAWTHDLARENDEADPEHGARGARLFRELAPSLFPELNEIDLDLIAGAIRLHNRGMTADEAVMTGELVVAGEGDDRVITCVGSCWDADRLDLLRLGIMPHPDRMSTEAWEEVLPHALEWHGWR